MLKPSYVKLKVEKYYITMQRVQHKLEITSS